MNSETKTVICRDIHGKTYEVPVEELSFRPAVYAVIIQDNKVLLAKEWDGYDFPGGGMNLGETIPDALVREVKEETGFDISVGQPIFSKDNFFKKAMREKFVHSILLYYTATVIGGEASKDFIQGVENEFMGMPEWIPLSEIKNIKFYNAVDSIALIEKAIKLR